MDPRHHSQDISGANTQRTGSNYAFNGAQNDPFNSFVHTDNESAFDSSWGNQNLPTQQHSLNGFDQSNHAWAQNPYQPSGFLGASGFGAASREFEQPYSRSPSSFNYQGFDPNQSHTFPSNLYDHQNPYENSLGYSNSSLNPNAQYEYPDPSGPQRSHETISPQALQNYPASFPNSTNDDNRQVSTQFPSFNE